MNQDQLKDFIFGVLSMSVGEPLFLGDSAETITASISATAIGNSAPPSVTRPEQLINGDFTITSFSDLAPIVGDGVDERTTWTLDFTQDSEIPSFHQTGEITSAFLTLELTPQLGNFTDIVGIVGLQPVESLEIRNLPLLETSTVVIDLLEVYSSDEILGALEASAGSIQMFYTDDAIVSLASLDLTGQIFSNFNRLDEALTFDPVQYLASHGDLIDAFGFDLVAATEHYNTFGQIEGRSADSFDEVRYLASNPDLITAFGDDFAAASKHFVEFGWAELSLGRSIDSFDPVSYLTNNPDLQTVFGGNLFEAALHYIQYGFAEGRLV